MIGATIMPFAAFMVLVCAVGAEGLPDEEGTIPPGRDLTGWRLCPKCQHVNPPDAAYCAYCGAKFEMESRRSPWRTPFLISGEFPCSAQMGWLMGGVGIAYDGGGCGEEFTAIPFFLIIPLGGFNDFQIYIRRGQLRPYVSITIAGFDYPEFEGGMGDDFFIAGGAAGGIRYNYDRRGSYLYAGGGAGYRRRGGDPYDAREGAVAIYKTRFTFFFGEHVGVTGSLWGWNTDVFASGGIAYAL